MPKKSITTIPAMIPKFSAQHVAAGQKRRVAAYARVSTDTDEQFTSYEAQIDYYTKYIAQRSDWEFVEVYSDEGISGTSTKHRDGFNRMIQDAMAGKIDLIITKSISRFARNTVDTLTTVRKLKEKGIEVFFEKENIYTLDSKGELLITIMSSIAQEESRSISEMLHGDSESGLRTEKYRYRISIFSVTEREKTVCRKLYRRRHRLSGTSIVSFLKEPHRI